MWRNAKYRKLKVTTLIIYLISFLFIKIQSPEFAEMWLTIFTAIIIWIHYSNHFNEKYVKPEPEWFFNTLPFRFHQIWISKFLTELLEAIGK